MQVEVYADIVFFINLIMDYFIFWIVSKLVKQKIKWFRLGAGALVTAVLYCMLIFLPALRMYYNIFATFFILVVGIMVAFFPKKLIDFVKLVVLAHVSAFAVGGLGIALFYYTNLSDMIGNFIGVSINNFSFKILLISICTSYILIKLSIGWIRKVLIKKQTFYTIKIHYHDDDLSLNTLLDTGNSLKCPLSNMPVIIAEFQAVKDFLPDSLKLVFYESKENNLADVLSRVEHDSIATRIRMIPFASLGKQNGMLLGFKPDMVEVFQEKQTISVKDCVIGIYNNKLSQDGSYQGLLNPDIL